MKNKWIINFVILVWVAGFNSLALFSVEDEQKMIKKLTPLVGNWKTHSIYPNRKIEAEGDIKIRWILDGQWMFVEFVGQHPERSVWEAYAFIKYDPIKQCYLSYSFFNRNSPVTMTGSWIDHSTIRFKIKTDTGTSGIDYTVKKNGTIYQENWTLPDQGKRQILLKTTYRRK